MDKEKRRPGSRLGSVLLYALCCFQFFATAGLVRGRNDICLVKKSCASSPQNQRLSSGVGGEGKPADSGFAGKWIIKSQYWLDGGFVCLFYFYIFIVFMSLLIQLLSKVAYYLSSERLTTAHFTYLRSHHSCVK